MILENAFGYLPEILTGSNYAVQNYEGGIVTAMSLAVLQELNARNIPNPLSNICVEKLYDNSGFSRGSDHEARRFLRADLHVDLSRVWVGSNGLARFGWRYKNWLEAKYLRKGKIASTTACAHLAADLLRLCAMVPPEARVPNSRDFTGPLIDPQRLEYRKLCTGRYLLHVYDSPPEKLVGKSRLWIRAVRTPGTQTLKLKIGDDKAKKEFIGKIGEQLKTATLEIQTTNFCRSQKPEGDGYLCVLSRIDSFRISIATEDRSLEYKENDGRTGTQSSTSDLKTIRSLVGAYVLLNDKATKDSDDVAPTADELQTGNQDEVEDDEA